MSDDRRRKELGRFLRTRRMRLSPESAGLHHVDVSRRRTKGLRREEIAALAGISLPWYTQLEQGRDIQVSDLVLESLARVLRLGPDERRHLFFLADSRRRISQPIREIQGVSSSLHYLLDQFSASPAYIFDEKMNVLAWNRLATAVFGSFETEHPHGRNLVWRMFMMPSHRSMYVEWESLAQSMLGHFRSMFSRHLEDPWYHDFIAELTEGSPEFAEWWEHYVVQCTNQHPHILVHPEVGRLHLRSQVMHIGNHHDQYFNVFIPDLNDGSAQRLAKLAEGMKMNASV